MALHFVPDAGLRRGLRALATPRVQLRASVVEVLVITGLMLALGHWVSPADPLFVQGPVAWSWFAPVLLALRYGVLAGLASVAGLALGWLLMTPMARGLDLPKLYFVAALLLTMVCGEFSGIWRARLRRMAEANHYLEDRVERVTKRLFMVQRSHDLLEQELMTRPTTLRQMLRELRSQGALGAEADAQRLLEFLAAHGQLECAQIVAIGADGQVRADMLAHIGQPEAVDPQDPLVRAALARGRLVHVQSDPEQPAPSTPHLLAAPIAQAGAEGGALLVVTRMPFLAFNDDAMQLLAVLCSAFAESARLAQQADAIRRELPGCPVEFAEEIWRLDRIAREFEIPSQLVVLTFSDIEQGHQQRSAVERLSRSRDVVWGRSLADGRQQLVTLMPLAGPAAVQGFADRVRRLFATASPMPAPAEGAAGGAAPVADAAPITLGALDAGPAQVAVHALGPTPAPIYQTLRRMLVDLPL